MPGTDIALFAASQLDLLEKELQAELAETADLATQSAPASLQRAGLAVLNLSIGNQRTGLGGKTVLELELDSAIGEGELPEHGIRVGDIVGVKEQVSGSTKKKEKAEVDRRGVDGVVIKTSNKAVSVALAKEDAEVPSGRLWIVKLANDVTHKRMIQVMTRLKDLKDSEHSTFMRVVFGQSSPSPTPGDSEKLATHDGDFTWKSDRLNDSQKNAIRFALASPEIALIHGPPGTGKTHTLIELILQLLEPSKQNQQSGRPTRVLVCGPSNISVDNIVERLAPQRIPMVRLGHPARLLPSVLNHSLDILTKTSDAAALVQDIRNEMDAKQASIRKTRNGRERKAIYGEMKELRKEYRERERGCVDQLVRSSRVVLSTLHGAGSGQLKQADFDVVIIDEAGQALEAQCWVPLVSAKKAILAGDHLQLPPTIKSLNSKTSSALKKSAKTKPAEAKEKSTEDGTNGKTSGAASSSVALTLETTLFDRLLALHGPHIKRMLTTQYRMHESIMAYPSTALYDSALVAADAVKAQLLKDLPYGVESTDDTAAPLVFYDTQGGDFSEKSEDEDVGARKRNAFATESKSNENEAALVLQHVASLVAAGVRAEDVAVITPYNAQLGVLRGLLKERFDGIELGSVDGFQGREKEAVVLSLVRSNTDHDVGFLGERRRLNVAMTRPRRHLCVVGDSETVGAGSAFLKAWMLHLEEHADLRYPDPSELNSTS